MPSLSLPPVRNIGTKSPAKPRSTAGRGEGAGRCWLGVRGASGGLRWSRPAGMGGRRRGSAVVSAGIGQSWGVRVRSGPVSVGLRWSGGRVRWRKPQGSARRRVSASANAWRQGQRAGRCSVQRRAVRVRLAGAQQVVRQGGDDRPGGVGGDLARGEVRERLVFEVADRQLDHGVLAVLRLDDRQVVGAVRSERA